jgi:hypothetical protein
LVVALLAVFPAPAQPMQLTPVKVEQRKAKPIKFRGEVLVITRLAITVRSRANTTVVRTFTYNQKLARKIARLIDQDKPFRYGDRVVIRFLPGSNQAVTIKGKPSSRPSP